MRGVVTQDGRSLPGAVAVVLTAGTFLRGVIHRGSRHQDPSRAGGRRPAVSIAQVIEAPWSYVSNASRRERRPGSMADSVDLARLDRQDGDPGRLTGSPFTSGRRTRRSCPATSPGPANSFATSIAAHLESVGALRRVRSPVADPGTARRSRTRSSSSPTLLGTKSFWSRKDWIPPRCTSTDYRPRCRTMSSSSSFDPFLVSNRCE